MTAKGQINETKNHFTKANNIDYISQLKPDDRTLLHSLQTVFGKMSPKELMRHTYITDPFYATKSEVASDILTKEELEKVEAAKPANNETILYTIGYEGISLEEYLVRLIKQDVKVLVDVRNNPLSMKYGFSKSQLKRYCESLGIGYVHIPEVGIQSEQRQELNSQADYDKLFTLYREQNLKNTIASQTQILNLLQEHKRIALTCFEANICQCHRKHLADAIESLPGFEYKVKHI